MSEEKKKHLLGPYEIRYHHAISGWCKIIGLKIKEIPECEGGGYMIPEKDAHLIVTATELLEAAENVKDLIEGWMNGPLFARITWESEEDHPPALKDLRKAIAKMKGKE